MKKVHVIYGKGKVWARNPEGAKAKRKRQLHTPVIC